MRQGGKSGKGGLLTSGEWVDLAQAGVRQAVQADFCVVGGGAAGIYLATELSRNGRDVVLLEAGPRQCVDAETIGLDALFDGPDYPGATAGRFFGMGGSTSRWGGQLVPHSHHDVRQDQGSAAVWAGIVNAVSIHGSAVLKRLHYAHGADFSVAAPPLAGAATEVLRRCGLEVQHALVMPFRHKNFVDLLPSGTSGSKSPRTFFNAVVSSWRVEPGAAGVARVTRLAASAPNGHRLDVTARRFVLAAGTIESARMMLELNESGNGRVLAAQSAVGCYLADHLSVSVADVMHEDTPAAVGLFAPRFFGPWMRSHRLLEAGSPPGSPRAFAHFIFSMESPGFELAREVLGALQGRRLPSLSVNQVLGGSWDLLRLAYHRYARSALYVPAGTPVHLQLDMEQKPVRSNRIRLADERDSYGRRKASIRWCVSDEDMDAVACTAQRLVSKWRRGGSALPELVPRLVGDGGTKPHDAYHPVGTCRMGEDGQAVVDRDLRVHGVENLWLTSTGVLPSAGTANPTFTMLCLTHKLAAHLQTLN